MAIKNHILKGKLGFILILFLSFVLSGCLTRTYTVIKERPDQQIDGNQGYIFGTPPPIEEKETKVRKTYVLEVELGKHNPYQETAGGEEEINSEEDTLDSEVISESEEAVSTEKGSVVKGSETKKLKTYIVQKNDTLEKIAARPEIYGDKKKWYRIYKENRDQIKSPDKIYAGQVLRIPE